MRHIGKFQSNKKKCSSQLSLEVVQANKDFMFGELPLERNSIILTDPEFFKSLSHKIYN